MIITIIFLVAIASLWSSTISATRRSVALFALFVYLFVTFVDLAYLNTELGRCFHFSDATEYYEKTRSIAFFHIFILDDSSNVFYIIINWLYNRFYDDPFVISWWIKINNALIIITAYLLLTRKQSSFSGIDLLLLFNPYLLVTITRNVRDAYIILFVSMIMMGLKYNKDNKCGILTLLTGLVLLALTRKILLVPFFIIFIIPFVKKHPKIKYPIIFGSAAVLYLFFYQIVDAILNQAVSAMEYVGEDVQEFAALFNHQYSLSTVLILVKRIIIGLISFLFTPHPINYISKWVNEADMYGTMGIYTGFDNFLISLGSIYSYLLIIPLMLYYFAHYKKFGDNVFKFIVFFIIIYTIAYMGITDIRNRFFVFFFILIALIYHNFRIKYPIKTLGFYYLATLVVFTVIGVISKT